MDEMTLLEFEDVRARQAELNCLGCHDPSASLAGFVDCISHPIDCVKEAWSGEPAVEAKRFPETPTQKTMRPPPAPGAEPQVWRTPPIWRPPPGWRPEPQAVRPYIGPECPPQAIGACGAPGYTFDPLDCSCKPDEVKAEMRKKDLTMVAAVGFGTLALLLLLRR